MLIFEIFVSLWLNECDGCVTLQDPNFVTSFPTLQYGFRAAVDRHYNYLSLIWYMLVLACHVNHYVCLLQNILVCHEPQITTVVLSIKFCNENIKHGQSFCHHYIFKIFSCALLVGSYDAPTKKWYLMMAHSLNFIFVAISYIKLHILIWILANKIHFHSFHSDAYDVFSHGWSPHLNWYVDKLFIGNLPIEHGVWKLEVFCWHSGNNDIFNVALVVIIWTTVLLPLI